MITVGVDLAAEAGSTAAVRVDWRTGSITGRAPAGDDAVLDLCEGADRIGIDCPFGWPATFVDLVVGHTRFRPPPPLDTVANRRPFAYRTTDLYVQQTFGLRPLSVSADRIAHAAFRCIGLLHKLDVTDRSGRERVVETYPAGALRVWGLDRPGYKRDLATCRAIGADLGARLGLTPGFEIGSDHELDALLCAVIARAVACGFAAPVPDEHLDAARVEGWIVMPDGDALTQLAGLSAGEPAGDHAIG